MKPFFDSKAVPFLLGALVGGTVASAILLEVNFPNLNVSASQTASSTAAATSASLPPVTGDVLVQNQPAGASVLIESVTVPPPGVWVAVQDLSGATLGNVLGAARVGFPKSNVVVPLLRNTVAGNQYAVVLYRNDTNGAFQVGENSIYVDFTSGQPVEVPFTAE